MTPGTCTDGGHEMSSAAAAIPKATAADAGEHAGADKKAGGKKKLILLAAPAVLAAVVAGLWFGGILPPLLGMGKEAKPAGTADGRPADQPTQMAVSYTHLTLPTIYSV